MLSIAVAGAGIGGLTVALAMREAGFQDIHVYEREEPGNATALGLEKDLHKGLEVSFDMGVVLAPNATRVLQALGLKDELRQICSQPRAQLQRSWRNGFLLSHRPLGEFAEARYGAPHCIVAHTALLRVLLDACAAQGITVVANAECTGVAQDAGAVVVELGDTRATHHVLIGCDGATSTVRRHLRYPQQGPPSGTTVHRGVAPAATLPKPLTTDAITTWLGPGQFFTHWLAPGGAHVEFIATICNGVPSKPRAATLASHFAGWHPHLATLIESSDPIAAGPATQHQPITQWYDRRVVLLGDACHALPPQLQQGAALAMEDAWVLSRMLERWEDEPATGFGEYQLYRKARVTRVRNASRLATAQWTLQGSRQVLLRNLKFSLVSRFLPEIAMQQLDWLYGYDCIKGFE